MRLAPVTTGAEPTNGEALAKGQDCFQWLDYQTLHP